MADRRSGSPQNIRDLISRLRERPDIRLGIRRAVSVDAVEAARSAGIKVGVLTNGFAQIQRRKLSAIGFEDIDVVVSEDVGVMKPDTGIFDVAAEQMALSPQSLLMVGNRYDSDVIGGNAAGWRTVWLNDPAMDIPDDSAANLVLSNPDDLPKLFAVGQA